DERRPDVNGWQRNLVPAPGDEPDFSAGIDLGTRAVHPLTGARLPVWAAPYVLGGYGTGAIMAVPAHDERDWHFARAHGLPIVQVVSGGNLEGSAYSGDGVLMNCGELDGLPSSAGARRIVDKLKVQRRAFER